MRKDPQEGLQGRRVIFRRKGEVGIENFEPRRPRDREVLIRTASSLISPGTETAFLMALPNTTGEFPQHPGYSNAGVVIAAGSKVSRFKEGDRVVSRKDHASHVVASEDELMMIPEGLSFDEATFFTLGSIALQGIRKAYIELGESVVVLGQGLVGQMALQLAKLSGGMPVVGADLYDYRLDLSSENGADHVLNPLKVDLVEEIEKLTQGKGADVVIEATGNAELINRALKLVGEYGRLIILGSPRGTSEVNFYPEIHRKGIHIIGAHNRTRPKHESYHGWWTQRDDSSLVLMLISSGRLNVRDLITAKMGFREAPEAYVKLINEKDSVLGIILDWNRT
jgi:L-iditol 2-dehydrogenase